MNGEHIANSFANIIIDAPPVADSLHYGGKVVIHKNKIGSFARDLAAALAHGNADVRVFECWSVVDAVACHGYNLAVLLECFYNAHFMFRNDAREDGNGLHCFL